MGPDLKHGGAGVVRRLCRQGARSGEASAGTPRPARTTSNTVAGTARGRHGGPPEPQGAARPRVSAHRDVGRVRQRYRRWTKGLLIERLLAVERAYAEQEDRWLRVNDELFTCQLRAASAPPDRAIVRADTGVPHYGYESSVTHRGE